MRPGITPDLTALDRRGVPWIALTNGSAYPASVQAPKLRAGVTDHDTLEALGKLKNFVRDPGTVTRPSMVAATFANSRTIAMATIRGT